MLHWGRVGESQAKRLDVPVFEDEILKLNELLKGCDPATFGLGGEAVLDESYRKAVKLDNNEFTTSFNPYEFGIIDKIGQLLLPSITTKRSLQLRGVRAELYKLNVSFFTFISCGSPFNPKLGVLRTLWEVPPSC